MMTSAKKTKVNDAEIRDERILVERHVERARLHLDRGIQQEIMGDDRPRECPGRSSFVRSLTPLEFFLVTLR